MGINNKNFIETGNKSTNIEDVYSLFFNGQAETREVIKVKDMMEMLGMSYKTATKVIRQVKSVSDRLQISGVIHKLDWIDYLVWRGNHGKKTID